MGLYLLNEISRIIGDKNEYGLYRDAFLGITKGSGPFNTRLRKKMEALFKENFLTLDEFEISNSVDYLDVHLNLNDNIHRPYRKRSNVPVYIHKDSCHPQNIIEQIPKMMIG